MRVNVAESADANETAGGPGTHSMPPESLVVTECRWLPSRCFMPLILALRCGSLILYEQC